MKTLTAAIPATVMAALALALFVLSANIANAGPLADRYNTLEETGLLDHAHDGLVAVEPADVTIEVLRGLVEEGKADIERIAENVWIVRQSLGDDRGVIWHAVVLDQHEGEVLAAIYVIGHELPAQPS